MGPEITRPLDLGASMSTVEEVSPVKVLPPLRAGERLDQPTFHERYGAMPEGTWAELVGGVVYIPSPLRSEHGDYDEVSVMWTGTYRRSAKGLRGGRNATVILDVSGECQPDGPLRIPEELGGRTRIVAGYIVGPPELLIEISRSSRYYDLGEKKADYEREGVLEYVVFELDPDRVHWFIRRGDHFEELPPGPDGIYRSEVFPGLWLDPEAFYAQDIDRLVEVVEQGLTTPEHADILARLDRERAARRPG
jgi:Uma2 family endonuclease